MRCKPPFRYSPSARYRLILGHVCAGYLRAGFYFRGSAPPLPDRAPDGHLQGDMLITVDGAPFAQLLGDVLQLLRPAHQGIAYPLQLEPAKRPSSSSRRQLSPGQQ